jgi:Domain of unknown function (DUF4169)
MMAEIVNLRRVRKQKTRDEKGQQAEENRARFGMTKTERLKIKAEEALDAKRLDAHKRDS